VHPHVLDASVDKTMVKLLIRDFTSEGLEEKEAFVEQIARDVVSEVPRASVEIRIAESYRNMREILEGYPEVVDCAREAIRRSGLTPVEKPIRGGTDGSRLSFMGLPTPNLFAGEQNFHSRLEWVSAQDMEKAVETIVNVCRVWEERS
jgi:tripeptide aminopeptidase